MGKLQTMALSFLIAKIFGTGIAAQLAMMVATGALGGGGGNNGSAGGGLISLSTVQSIANMMCTS